MRLISVNHRARKAATCCFLGVTCVVGCLSAATESPGANTTMTATQLTALFRAEARDYDACLAAIPPNSDALAELLVEEDCAWLADTIADTVKLAPFDERRKACFESLVNIARRALRSPSVKTAPDSILRMPARSILLCGIRYRVVPGYGAEQIESLIVEFQGDSRWEVREACGFLAGVLGTTLRDRAPACLAIVQNQLKFESERSSAEGVEHRVLESRIRSIQFSIDELDGIINQGWEPFSIPDTECRTLLTSSREELLQRACDGHWAALTLLMETPPNAEERERLLAAASNDFSGGSAWDIIGALSSPIIPDRPREDELLRIDQVIACFEHELRPAELHRHQQQEYAKDLFRLAGGGSRSEANAGPELLDLKRGQAVIKLIERFLSQPESEKYVANFLSRLRKIYVEKSNP